MAHNGVSNFDFGQHLFGGRLSWGSERYLLVLVAGFGPFGKPTRMLLEDEQTEGTNSQQPLFRAAADFEFPCMLDYRSSQN